MDSDDVPYHYVDGINFSIFSSKEIKKLSVKKITNPNSFDILGHPNYGGLHDPALGPNDRDDLCETCSQSAGMCPGHMGHIEIRLPVYNPVLFMTLFKLLRGTCFTCHQLNASKMAMFTFTSQLRVLELGMISLVDELQDMYSELLAEGQGQVQDEVQMQDSLQDLINNRLQENSHSMNDQSNTVKNIVNRRQELVRNFIGGSYFAKKTCPHCKAPVRKLKQERHSKVFFEKAKAKSQAKKLAQQRREMESKRNQEIRRISEEQGDTEVDEVVMETENNNDDIKSFMENNEYLSPMEIRCHLRQVWDAESEILSKVLGVLNPKEFEKPDMGLPVTERSCPMDVFFIETMAVPPNRFRPLCVGGGDRKYENAQSTSLGKVIADSITVDQILREMGKRAQQTELPSNDDDDDGGEGDNNTQRQSFETVPGATLTEKLQNAWQRLQVDVNCVIDSDLDKLNNDKKPGIKQLLEKKTGLFRKHMMGKRVNYAARSVISPDPYIATNEVGIPDVFARKLTFPQPVTPWNFQELKQAVINGPNVHPGASMVENEDGSKIILRSDKRTQREAVAKQLLTPSTNKSYLQGAKKVYRHLKNGDVLLLNRQPTLHRPSIQAHKARIIPGEKTLRLHYSNCKAYNADFDGDEMNAHFPQDEISRSEAYNIVSTDYQYLVPKDGTPLGGLIQDHMIAGVTLSIRGRFFCRADYQELVFSGLIDNKENIKLLPPTIIKPQVLWSGKQILSTLILNIIPDGKAPLNLNGKTKINSKNWNNSVRRNLSLVNYRLEGDEMTESEVVILQGQLLVGVLDKAHYGPSSYGLVHACYELYGGNVAGKLLTGLARLFTAYLQRRGFTLGVEDILCNKPADAQRRQIMAEAKHSGDAVAGKALHLSNYTDKQALHNRLQQAQFCNQGSDLKDLDLCMKGLTDEVQNSIAKVCMPMGLEKHFPHNNLQLMVQAGAKGSLVNCMQISCLLGQIELEGRRPPLSISGQTLPSFLAYDTSPRAGGFIDGRFLTGIRPQEYFFHCMAGREGLVDTAVKTSRSGYLQRCIIKHLEGLSVSYDLTVRDSDGSIVQFQYGEDGLEILKTPYLREKQIPFLISNHKAVVDAKNLDEVMNKVDIDTTPRMWKKYKKWKKRDLKQPSLGRKSAFLSYCQNKWDEFSANTSRTSVNKFGRTKSSNAVCDSWFTLDESEQSKYGKRCRPCPDPVISRVNPFSHFGAVSEKIEALIDDYTKKNQHKFSSKEEGHNISEKDFRHLMYFKTSRSLAEPGENVGLLAAQSIGEPSTQMTLNTFHFAGRGEMNVTLGIPRLREILMVASATIKTPSMDIPLRTELSDQKEKAQKLKMKLTKVLLSEVLESIEINESISVKSKGRLYKIRFHFLPHHVYKNDNILTPSRILSFMEKAFFTRLNRVITRKDEELLRTSLLQTASIRERPRKNVENEGSAEAEGDSDADEGDNDATAEKKRRRQLDEQDYDGEDQEKEELDDGGKDSDLEDADPNDDDDNDDEKADGLDEVDNEEPTENNQIVFSRTPSKFSRKQKTIKKMSNQRINAVINQFVIDYQYDADEELWCEATIRMPLNQRKVDMTSLLDNEVRQIVVYQTKGISRCFVSDSKVVGEEGVSRIKTEGINIQEMNRYSDILNLDKLYSNDIHAMSRVYGIEAAAQVIIMEIRNVFAAYGIDVDYRHLSLISDYMTFEGQYKALNRFGIESNPSPLQKMTFETTMHFLRNATITGAKDDLKSPSSRLVVGRLVAGGTGSFDVLQPMRS